MITTRLVDVPAALDRLIGFYYAEDGKNHKVLFRAPVELQSGDWATVETRTGFLHRVFRRGYGIVWRARSPDEHFTSVS